MMGGSFSFVGPAIFCYGHLGLSKTKCTPNKPKNPRIANNDQWVAEPPILGYIKLFMDTLPLSVRTCIEGFPCNLGVRGVRDLSPKCAIAFAPGRNCGKLFCPTVCNRSPPNSFATLCGEDQYLSLPLCSAHVRTSKFSNPLGFSQPFGVSVFRVRSVLRKVRHKNVSQKCPRGSSKSLARVSDKNVLRECATQVFSKESCESVFPMRLPKCLPRGSHKVFSPKRFHKTVPRMSAKTLLQERL